MNQGSVIPPQPVIQNKKSSKTPTSSQPQSTSSKPLTSSSGGHSFFLPYAAPTKSCKCNSVSGVEALQPFEGKLLNNKWFLYAINGTDHNIDQFYYYFLIINPQRMIYYGVC